MRCLMAIKRYAAKADHFVMRSHSFIEVGKRLFERHYANVGINRGVRVSGLRNSEVRQLTRRGRAAARHTELSDQPGTFLRTADDRCMVRHLLLRLAHRNKTLSDDDPAIRGFPHSNIRSLILLRVGKRINHALQRGALQSRPVIGDRD